MKALYKVPGDAGFHEVIIRNELGLLQQLVGGHIETLTVAEGVCVICNEEGRLTGQEYNCEFLGVNFVGPILIVGTSGDEFTDCPWSVMMANGGIEG